MAASPFVRTQMDELEVLARCCAETTRRHVQSSVDKVSRIDALFGDAMTAMRRCFAAALAANAESSDECRRRLEAAIEALQSEDALVQMLDGVRDRTLQTADILRYVVTSRCSGNPSLGPGSEGRTDYEEMAARLRLTVIALDAGIARSGRVGQTRAVVGTVAPF